MEYTVQNNLTIFIENVNEYLYICFGKFSLELVDTRIVEKWGFSVLYNYVFKVW